MLRKEAMKAISATENDGKNLLNPLRNSYSNSTTSTKTGSTKTRSKRKPTKNISVGNLRDYESISKCIIYFQHCANAKETTPHGHSLQHDNAEWKKEQW
ncbi:hypothetical protein CEXT_325851 [Caerostris extrusa]|uniref:Uncharacterized protein n=1 Tax=Caerostris extrusa TaxID=172846 RepID=A0AAV4S9A7_CAEEX|nr:hypothetical protein CEXT_325851 [Caerostris extrusa]